MQNLRLDLPDDYEIISFNTLQPRRGAEMRRSFESSPVSGAYFEMALGGWIMLNSLFPVSASTHRISISSLSRLTSSVQKDRLGATS